MATELKGEPIEILLVEDNPGDVRLTTEILKESKVRFRINVAVDGADAMDYLRCEGKHVSAPRPDLILLDLNLPKKDGREVLAEIKRDPELKRIPVVVITASLDERDILEAYDNYANCYIAKPVELEGVINVVKSVEEFWLEIVKLPPRQAR
jgi:two-component system, chemotaxis family, response regulator Rcp1